MNKLSVVLLTWNSEKHIKPCISSLLASINHLDFEIIVVDNGSTDGSISLIESFEGKRIQLIKNTQNRGVAAARNQALKLVQGDYVLILDIDMEINQAAIDAMIACLDKQEDVACCGTKLVAADGEVQQSCRKFPSLRYKVNNVLEKKGLRVKSNESQFYTEQMAGEVPFEVDYLIGACQLFRKEILDTVGLLDEQIFYGPEDADFCLRMKQAGWKIVYLPSVSLIHHYQRLSHASLVSKVSRMHAKALIYYFWKHRSTLKNMKS